MDLVQIGQGVVFAGQGDGAGQVGDVAVHGIDALEGDQLGRIGRRVLQQGLEMLQVVVGEDVPLAAAVADAGDHRGVVQAVREDDQTRQDALQGGQGRLIGHIAGGEQQRRFLPVPAGQLGLKVDRRPRRAGDVARAAGTRADLVDLGLHGLQHRRMLAHAQIVVRAPDHHVLLGPILAAADCPGELAAHALQVRKDAIAPFALHLLNSSLECGLVVEQAEQPRTARNQWPGDAPIGPICP
jgi:hypothetical protein